MYLHDTSQKYLFAREKRFYSHSCIRLENPKKLGAWLMKPNSAVVDRLSSKSNYYDKQPSYYAIKREIPVVIWYSQVDFDEKGNLKIYPNIYGRN
jgi:murein L,D-transpeptidase YcbB/YkuD